MIYGGKVMLRSGTLVPSLQSVRILEKRLSRMQLPDR